MNMTSRHLFPLTLPLATSLSPPLTTTSPVLPFSAPFPRPPPVTDNLPHISLATWQDLSLVRHLIQQLLALASPPYSEVFARRLLGMLRHPRTLEAHRAAESRRGLLAATEHIGRMPALAAEAQATLEVLQPGAT